MKKVTKKRPGPPKTKGKDPMRALRVPSEEWEEWKKTAARRGMSLTAWLRALANRAARP